VRKRPPYSLSLAGALVLGAAVATAEDRARPELRALVDAFSESGDLEGALAALEKAHATPAELLKTLRAPQRPSGEPVGGVQNLELKDGHNGTTDLLVVAPPLEEIKKHAEKGLGLIVALHGLGGSSRQAKAIADKLVAAGDVVVVAPSAKKIPDGEGTEDDGIPEMFKQRHWWMYDSPRSFPLEAIRKARSLFPIDVDRICLSGMSMGGYGTWNIGLRHPDIFAGLAPLAGGISRFRVKSDEDEISAALLQNGRNTPFLSIHGTSDSIVPYGPDKEAIDMLKALGGKAELRSLEGTDHDLRGVHAGRTEDGDYLVKWLVEQRRNPSPEAVTFASTAERLDGAYWARIVKRSKGVKYPRLEAQIDRATNTISVRGTGVSLARVYIDERLLDLSKPVTIKAGGQTRTKKKLEPDFKSILESWRSRRDEQLVYPAFVEVDPRVYE